VPEWRLTQKLASLAIPWETDGMSDRGRWESPMASYSLITAGLKMAAWPLPVLKWQNWGTKTTLKFTISFRTEMFWLNARMKVVYTLGCKLLTRSSKVLHTRLVDTLSERRLLSPDIWLGRREMRLPGTEREALCDRNSAWSRLQLTRSKLWSKSSIWKKHLWRLWPKSRGQNFATENGY